MKFKRVERRVRNEDKFDLVVLVLGLVEEYKKK